MSCKTCFQFYCMFYFTCDRSLRTGFCRRLDGDVGVMTASASEGVKWVEAVSQDSARVSTDTWQTVRATDRCVTSRRPFYPQLVIIRRRRCGRTDQHRAVASSRAGFDQCECEYVLTTLIIFSIIIIIISCCCCCGDKTRFCSSSSRRQAGSSYFR